MREGVRVIASNACFGLTPLRCGFGWAPRDQALRSQVSSGKDELSRYARGVVVIASNARFGPIPLRCGFEGSARSVRARRERWDRRGFPALSRWGGSGCRRSYARRGPIPLRCGFGWAPQDQALRSQVSSNKEELSRCARGGEVDRFQCSLRPDPAPLRGRSHLFTQKGTLLTIQLPLRWLRRTGPALAGNMGTGGAFALAREGE